jgi:hypothetical protein
MTTTEVNDSMRNGVDTATLFATLDAVKQAPAAARFQFRAHNEWQSGTHNRSTISDFFGVGEAPSRSTRPDGAQRGAGLATRARRRRSAAIAATSTATRATSCTPAPTHMPSGAVPSASAAAAAR